MIKMRAWDKKNKKMIYFDLNNIYGYEGEVSGVVLPDGYTMLNYSDYEDKKINKNLEFMLCSPWNDKNGKEIYEGDFIKAEWGIGNADYRIVGEDGLPEFYHWFIEYCFEEDNLEVIGNKYEDPELIE